MRKTLIVSLPFVFAATASAADSVQQLTQPELQQITAWRRDLHQHPELSNRETRTASLMRSRFSRRLHFL